MASSIILPMSANAERSRGYGTISQAEVAQWIAISDAESMILARMRAGEIDDSLAGAMAEWSHFLFGIDTSGHAMGEYFLQQSASGVGYVNGGDASRTCACASESKDDG